MKNIVFEINTSSGKEKFFLPVNERHSINLQIDMALAEICYCDAYEIVSYTEVTEEYVRERIRLIASFEKMCEPISEAFCNGNLVTLGQLKSEMKWRRLSRVLI